MVLKITEGLKVAKTLNEMAGDLKAMIVDILSDVRDKRVFRPERYNNLKFEMNVARDRTPTLHVTMGISYAKYDILTGEKLDGSLGMDERYIQRWFGKRDTIANLMQCWNARVKNRGKITEVE